MPKPHPRVRQEREEEEDRQRQLLVNKMGKKSDDLFDESSCEEEEESHNHAVSSLQVAKAHICEHVVNRSAHNCVCST